MGLLDELNYKIRENVSNAEIKDVILNIKPLYSTPIADLVQEGKPKEWNATIKETFEFIEQLEEGLVEIKKY